MKRIKDLFTEIVSRENLEYAWIEVEKVKRNDKNIGNFAQYHPLKLMDLEYELKEGIWRPKPKQPFIKREKKTRIITPIDERGKIVGQAIYRKVANILKNKYIYETHACVKDHGQHMAALRVQKEFFQIPEYEDFYPFKGDIHHYFQSVNHPKLEFIIEEYFVKDKLLLTLLFIFIEAYSEGIPIGWLTSEIFANMYLYLFDIYITENFPDLFYSRFMDDFIINGTNKKRVEYASKCAIDFIRETLLLEINPKTKIYHNQVNYCGYNIYKQYMIPRSKVIKSANRRLKKYIEYGEFDKFKNSLNSFFGYCAIAESRSTVENIVYKLLKNILSNEIPTEDPHEFFIKAMEFMGIKNQFEMNLGARKKFTSLPVSAKKIRNIKLYNSKGELVS